MMLPNKKPNSFIGDMYLAWAEGNTLPLSLGPELLIDGDMELGNLTNWPAYSSPSTREKSTAQKYAGSQSLHIVSGGGAMGAQQNSILLEIGATYRISVWVKCVTGIASVYDNFAGAGYQVTGTSSSTSWTEITADVVAATTSPRSLLLLESGANECYFDNASVRKVL